MSTLPTNDEIITIAKRGLLEGLDPDGTGTVNLRSGSSLSAFVSSETQLWNRQAAYTGDRAAAAQLDSAEGDDLTEIAETVYLDSRKGNTPSVGTLYLQRSGLAGSSATSIPAGSRFGDGQKVTLGATSDIVVAVGQTKCAVPVVCSTAGSVGNVDLATITQILDTLPDSSWSLYVPEVADPYYPPDDLGGGQDAEDDTTLRARLRSAAPDEVRAGGTLRASLFGALRVPGVTFATIVEPLDGRLLVFAGDVNYALPASLRTAIQTELLNWRTGGVPTTILPYTKRQVALTITLSMQSPLANYDRDALTRAAVVGVQAYFANRPSPDEVFFDGIRRGAMDADDTTQSATVVMTVDGSPVVADIKRPATDAAYGSLQTINRYILGPSATTIVLSEPQRSP